MSGTSLVREAPAPNPFPGLRPFEAEESARFFGRQQQLRALLGKLRRSRFLSIVGASGSGKSSLVRAGLVAALQQGFMVEDGAPWRIVVLRPGDSPLARLADALDLALGTTGRELRSLRLANLRSGPRGLIETIGEAGLTPGTRTFVLVDQFEELFRFADRQNPARTREEARAFVKLLVAAAAGRDLPIYVALTLRSEFLGDCADLPGLPESINQGLYLVPQMSRDQLREAIAGPVETAGGRVADRLVDRLLNDLGDVRDQLPLLQHAMMRLWRRLPTDRPRVIDLDHYTAIGSLSGALAGHLEEVFRRLPPADQRTTELLFRALTEQTDEKRTIRRPTRLDRLCEVTALDAADVTRIIDIFRAEGRSFLMPGPGVPLAADTIVDISHESLIRQWTRLGEWVTAEAREAKMGRRVHAAALDWDASGREPSYLFHGARLAEAEEWSHTHPERIDALAQQFLVASLALRHRQESADIAHRELPRSITAAATSRTEAIRKGTSYLYLLADPADHEGATALAAALRAVGREVSTDPLAIDSEEGAAAVRVSLDAADAVLVLLSPAFCASARIRPLLDHACSRKKRIIPLAWRRVELASVHPAIAPLHWIDISGASALRELPSALLEAVDADLPWTRAHARLLVRATEWELRHRDPSVLLAGLDLQEAEAWLAGNRPGRLPEVTPVQVGFILASRGAAQRRLRIVGTVAAVLGVVLLAALVVAITQRFQANESARLATERLDLLLAQWGRPGAVAPTTNVVPTTANPAPPPDEGVQRSLAANDLLTHAAAARPAEDRSAVRVQYFASGDIEPPLVGALRSLGFTVTRSTSGVGAAAVDSGTNALWFGPEVPLSDAKAVAFALIRAGIDLKYVGRFRDPAGRESVIQIGSRPRSDRDAALPLDAIWKAEDFPAS